MDYKNFFLRSLFSILFIVSYILITFLNFNFVFYLILFLYLLVFFEIYFYFEKYKLYPLIYIIISLVFFLLVDFNEGNFLKFNIFVFIVVVFDTFSYIIGKTLGKNKLIKISPHKTIEGLIGGIFFSLIFSLILLNFLQFDINITEIIYILFVIIFAFLGDIIESYFKRKNNLKNSSLLIPGHGGIFDRFDSFLFSIIFYSISINFL